MARIDNLENFLTDVAGSIKAKKGITDAIPAENFDTEIAGIPTGTVVEKVSTEASEIVEEENAVKIDSNPIQEQIVVPENGTVEVLADKALLAENIGLTADKIVKGTTILNIEGIADGGGSHIYDATAEPNDVISPKVFYNNKGRKVGSMIPEYSTSEPSLLGIYDLDHNIGSISNWSTICLGEYTFFYWVNSSNICKIAAIKGNKLDAVSQDFTASELYGMNNRHNCLITYDSYDNSEYIICPGHGFNNGNGNTNVRVRRIKYDTKEKTFEVLPGIASGNWGDTGNNYGYAAVGAQSHPNHIYVQYSYWDNRLNFGYVEINWTETSGSMRNVWFPGRIMGFSYGLWETGNGHQIACNNKFIVLNNSRTSGTSCDASGKMFVSHNCEYGIMNRVLYKLTPSENASTMYNSRQEIASGLPNYNIIEFTDGDDYALLFNGVNTYVLRFNDDGFDIIQTISNSNYGTGTGAPFTGKSYVAIDGGLNMYINYYSANMLLNSLERDGMKYVLANNKTTPSSSNQVLNGVSYISTTGVHHGTMPNNGELNFNPSTEEQNIPEGYTSGGIINAVTSEIDSNIISDNIKSGVEILGVTGTYEPTGGDATSDANIQAKYLLEGYKAVSDGKWVEGEMVNYGTVTMERTSEIQEIPSGYYDSLTVPIAQAYNLDGYNECLNALIYITHGAPVSYTELNYIQSTGTQYIDTGITMNKTDNVIIEQKCAISNDRYAGCNGYTQWTGDITNNVDSVVKVVYTSTNNTETIYVDGVQKTSNLWDNYNGSNVKIGIFKLGEEGNTWHESSAQVGILYYCKIYKNNKLVRDFVPAQRDEDSVVGLYDKVSKMFFVNNGTGNFVSGGVKE